jgi:hypothetical protein
MTLLEQIEARKPKRQCAFGRWVLTASKQDRADIAAAFADKTLASKWIADVLDGQIDGNFIDGLRDHRRGDCSACPAVLFNVAS